MTFAEYWEKNGIKTGQVELDLFAERLAKKVWADAHVKSDFNPYQFIADNIEKRPFDETGKEDGSYNFIHRCDAITLVERMKLS